MRAKNPLLVSMIHGRSLLNVTAPGNDGMVCDFLDVFNYNTVCAIITQLDNRSPDYSAQGYTRTPYIDALIKCNFSAGNAIIDALEIIETSIYKVVRKYINDVSFELGYGVFEVKIDRIHRMLRIEMLGDYRIFEWEKMTSDLSTDVDFIDGADINNDGDAITAKLGVILYNIEQHFKLKYSDVAFTTGCPVSLPLTLTDIDNLWCEYGAGSSYPEGWIYDLLARELKPTDIEYCTPNGICEEPPRVLFNKITSVKTLVDIKTCLEIINDGVCKYQ